MNSVSGTSALAETRARFLASLGWSRDGHNSLAVYASREVPSCHDGMIRRALLRGALKSGDLDTLKIAISRELWTVGYFATINVDPADTSVVVEVSQLH